MKGRTIVVWVLEFAAITAIGVISSKAWSLWWLALPAGLIVCLKLLEGRRQATDLHLQIRRQLQLLLSVLPTDGAHVRCTYHVPVKRLFSGKVRLRQVFDYVGDQGGGGRSFAVEKGIVGVAYSQKETRVENFSSDVEYRQHMLTDYGYTSAEVGRRRADRRSYLCDPVLDEAHRVLGLLYFDSDRCGLFTLREGDPRWRMIRAATALIRGQLLSQGR
jgi:hypothetical protein